MLESELVQVTGVRHMRSHVLWVEFSDGLSGEVDLGRDLTGEMLEPLRDTAVFALAGVDHGIVVWPGGLDWSPESLYDRVRAVKGLPPRPIDEIRRRQVEHSERMPEISRFFGIVISMLATEHEPPHFHAVHGEFAISVTIRDGLVTGRFPRAALRLVLQWGELHRDELLANWERMRRGKAAQPIEPLE